MDPVTLIVAALVAGAAAGIKDTAAGAVRDAYATLKGLLGRRFAAHPAEVASKEQSVLEEHEKDPETYEKPMAKVVRESGAAEDEEILTVAQKLLEAADPSGAATGKYNVTVSGSHHFIVGDDGTINE